MRVGTCAACGAADVELVSALAPVCKACGGKIAMGAAVAAREAVHTAVDNALGRLAGWVAGKVTGAKDKEAGDGRFSTREPEDPRG